MYGYSCLTAKAMFIYGKTLQAAFAIEAMRFSFAFADPLTMAKMTEMPNETFRKLRFFCSAHLAL